MQSPRRKRAGRNDVFLGVDAGTTVLKACAVDSATGNVLAHVSRRLPLQQSVGGGREQNVRGLDNALGRAVKSVREALGDRWDALAGIGLAAQGGSSIMADRKTGAPLTPMILWNDTRAQACAGVIAERTTPEFWREFTLRDGIPHGLARLVWLRERAPALFHDFNIHAGAGEWIFHRLTGIWRQDPGNAIQVGSYNAATKCLDAAAFDVVDLPLSLVATLRDGHETAPLSKAAAKRFRLPAGLPMAGPYIDQEAGYLSAVGISPRPVHCSLGTAWVCNYTRPDSPHIDSPRQLVLRSVLNGGQLVVLPLKTGNAAWDFILQTFLDSNHNKALEKAAEIFQKRLIPSEDAFAASVAPDVSGIPPNPYPGWRADVIRAVVAGMVFELAEALETPIAKKHADAIVLGGGASKGSYFCRMIAALYPGVPVRRQTGEALAAARGALYAFSPRIACAPTAAVRRPGEADCNALRQMGIQYQETRSIEE